MMSAEDLVTLSRHDHRRLPRVLRDLPRDRVHLERHHPAEPQPAARLGLGVDGLKTGHTAEAGYGLVGSAVQNGQRVVFVVSGLDSERRARRRDRGDREMGLRRLRDRALLRRGRRRWPRPRSGSARRRRVPLVAPDATCRCWCPREDARRAEGPRRLRRPDRGADRRGPDARRADRRGARTWRRRASTSSPAPTCRAAACGVRIDAAGQVARDRALGLIPGLD